MDSETTSGKPPVQSTLQFTGHNILLADSETTMTNRPLLAGSAFVAVLKKILIDAFGADNHQHAKLKLVDLACMEGGFATEFARMGFKVTGIDARKYNVVKANYVKFKTHLDNLNFVVDDVRNLAKYGPFDITCCLGILYHLDKPAAFLKTMYEQTNKILIIHSFYAPERSLGYTISSTIFNINRRLRKRFKLKNKQEKLILETKAQAAVYIQHLRSNKLGKLTNHEGYNGRWYREWKEDTDKQKVEADLKSSYNNNLSFWLCKKDMIQALYDAGFSNVTEITDDIGDLASKYPSKFHERTLLVATK